MSIRFMMQSFFSMPNTHRSLNLLAVLASQPAHKGHTMPEKKRETKGIAEVSAIQLSSGSGKGEGARGWCEGMGVLNN
jgi:hypothetical protein